MCHLGKCKFNILGWALLAGAWNGGTGWADVKSAKGKWHRKNTQTHPDATHRRWCRKSMLNSATFSCLCEDVWMCVWMYHFFFLCAHQNTFSPQVHNMDSRSLHLTLFIIHKTIPWQVRTFSKFFFRFRTAKVSWWHCCTRHMGVYVYCGTSDASQSCWRVDVGPSIAQNFLLC